MKTKQTRNNTKTKQQQTNTRTNVDGEQAWMEQKCVLKKWLVPCSARRAFWLEHRGLEQSVDLNKAWTRTKRGLNARTKTPEQRRPNNDVRTTPMGINGSISISTVAK